MRENQTFGNRYCMMLFFRMLSRAPWEWTTHVQWGFSDDHLYLPFLLSCICALSLSCYFSLGGFRNKVFNIHIHFLSLSFTYLAVSNV